MMRTWLAIAAMLALGCTPRAVRMQQRAVAHRSVWRADSLAVHCNAPPLRVTRGEHVVVQFMVMPDGAVDPTTVLLYQSSSSQVSRWVRRTVNNCRFHMALHRVSTEAGGQMMAMPESRVWRVYFIPLYGVWDFQRNE
jgi:hypothetical protein